MANLLFATNRTHHSFSQCDFGVCILSEKRAVGGSLAHAGDIYSPDKHCCGGNKLVDNKLLKLIYYNRLLAAHGWPMF